MKFQKRQFSTVSIFQPRKLSLAPTVALCVAVYLLAGCVRAPQNTAAAASLYGQ